MRCVVIFLLIASLTLYRVASAASNCEAPSPRLSTFLYMLSGYYSTIKMVKKDILFEEDVIHDVINTTFTPIQLDVLLPDCVFVMEEVINNKVFRLQVLRISEDDMGFIRIQPYNFTDPSKYRPRQFDLATLNDLNMEDLHTRDECEVIIKQIDDTVFFGTWPDCTRVDAYGEHPKYAIVLSCNTISTLIFWRESREHDNVVPYDQKRFDWFPLLAYMTSGASNFQLPCKY
ncbi:uncharacterized protein LOC131943369 [Physella acuta]|uniref:uncharacterized protein LOC131943369 n=1 Tax=Physella acuta TaxID=109671 RepID=UPI0027DCEB48|nr:uncharacterized protein LOC131943369 [Physella acuta]